MDSQLQLHDIHFPGDPHIWPLAIGWWILMVLGIILVVLLIFKVKRFLYVKNHKRMLHKEYAALETKLKNSPDKSIISEANVLLRRLALAYYPEKNIASLTGSEWLTFLDKSGNTQDFSLGAGRILIEAPYRSGELENYNGDEFIPLIRNWVNKTIGKVGGCL